MKIRGGEFLVLNMEPKERSLTPALRNSQATVIDMPSWTEIMQIMTAEYPKFNAGIAIDGLAGYARECMFDVLGYRGDRMNIGQKELPNQNTWHIWGERLRNHVTTIVGRGFPFIVTGHVQFKEDKNSGEIFKSVNLWGKMAIELPAMFTVCGLCNYFKTAKGEQWEVKFRPERGYPARDTLGILNATEPCDFAAIWNKLSAGRVEAGATSPDIKSAS
jgi:hypothetical protein